jgi:hypothetical protein
MGGMVALETVTRTAATPLELVGIGKSRGWSDVYINEFFVQPYLSSLYCLESKNRSNGTTVHFKKNRSRRIATKREENSSILSLSSDRKIASNDYISIYRNEVAYTRNSN